jgi:hypothetical protein
MIRRDFFSEKSPGAKAQTLLGVYGPTKVVP